MNNFRKLLLIALEKQGIVLDDKQIAKFELYYSILNKRNKDINLVASTAEEDIVWKHFVDSIALPKEVVKSFLSGDPKLIDIGTGAGFPGIPLKIILPLLKVSLLEATTKKIAFLKEVVESLSLPEIAILEGRAEDLAHDGRYRESFEVVVGRAVAELPTFAELALPFAAVGGVCVAYKGPTVAEELEIGHKAVGLMGGVKKGVFRYNINDFNRALVVIEKVKYTPKEYPRRPGMPKKRPIL